MGTLSELYDLRTFESRRAFDEFLVHLAQAIQRGWVEEIPIHNSRKDYIDRRWFRDTVNGEIYELAQVEGHASSWKQISPE